MAGNHIIPQLLINEYNTVRQAADTSVLCHAPFSNIYFNQSGDAVACCYNSTHVLGTYPQDSLQSMWFGDKARELRRYIRNNDLGGGCQSCAHQLHSRNFTGQMSVFDRMGDGAGGPADVDSTAMPKQLEFSLTNTCNLECVMCGGYWSSLIRRNREKLAPLNSPYDHKFVEQLDEFLPHLHTAKFFGGEPFLIRIYHDIWERIRVVNPNIKVYVTTNATTLTKWGRELLDSLQVFPILSIDSLQRETFESIRLNANYDTVMDNLAYFQKYCRQHGRTLSFAVCPMQQNWHELPDLVAHCNRNQISVYFNTVYYPEQCSLSSLTAAELDSVIAHWESFAFPTTEGLQKQNAIKFRNVINQAIQWRKEAAERDRLRSKLAKVTTDLPACLNDSRQNLLGAGDIAQEATAQLTRVFTISLELLQSSTLESGVEGNGLDQELGSYLGHLAKRLDALTFVRVYFDALNASYLATHRHLTEQQQRDFASKTATVTQFTCERPAAAKVAVTHLTRGISGVLRWFMAVPNDGFAASVRTNLDRMSLV